jgi:hypothetical protein
VLTGAFLSVVATTISLKTHGSVLMSTIAILQQQSLLVYANSTAFKLLAPGKVSHPVPFE